MFCSHLQSLLKKNLLIAKSTFILTAIEILAPIIIMLALLGLKSLFKKENMPFEADSEYIDSNSSLLFSNLNEIFGDEIEEIEQLEYLNSFYMCQERNVIALVGKKFSKKFS